MVTISKRLGFVLVPAVAALALAGAARAQSAQLVVKPAQGIALDVGSKKIAGYYMAGNGVCDVTLMVGERADADGTIAAGVSRMNVPVKAGTRARVYTADGRAIELSCSLKTNVMAVRALEQTAVTSGK